MKQVIKINIIAVITVLLVFLLTGCGETTTPYQKNNSEGYTVSVKFDANGGAFTTNTTVIVDSFNSEGKTKLSLIAPDDARRKNDAFSVSKNGHFFAGWFTDRIETTDENGQASYEYSNRWDFENDVLKLDVGKQYSANEPALTLYAAWLPLFEIEFYSISTGDLIDTIYFDPTKENEFLLPAWDEETGAIEMYDFPKRDGYTYNQSFYDNKGVNQVVGEKLTHPGIFHQQDATSTDSVLKLYVDWTEGEWYRIYNVEQFKESASINGCYELFADLDFSNEIWPTSFLYGNFTGSIKGNGHTIKNVDVIQTNNSKVNAGLFGSLDDSANISDVNFENISFTIKAGTRKVGTNFGLFAGKISDNAILNNVNIINSHLKIDSSCYFAVDDFSIGLVCGTGDFNKISTTQIDCTATGDNPENIAISTSGNAVTVEVKN